MKPVKKYYQQFKSIRADLRQSSRDVYDRSVKWFIELHGDIDIENIRYSDIEDYKSWLLNGRSESAANTYLRALKSFFSWLAKRRYIVQSPFDGVTMYKAASKRFEIYKVSEIEKMLNVADDLWRIIICLGLCGMRESEILNLVVSDIDFEKSRIKITGKNDTESTWKWQIKNSQEALVGLDDSILKMLIKRIENIECPYVCLKKHYWQRNLKLKAVDKLPYILRLRPWGNFDRDFKALLKRAGVARKRFHDLRSTFATERFKSGYDIKEVQRLMRHANIQTTAIYLRNIDDEQLAVKSAETFRQKYYETLNVP